MSAYFTLYYKGQAVLADPGQPVQFVEEKRATQYLAAADAWYAAYQNNLLPQFCDVRDGFAKQSTTQPS